MGLETGEFLNDLVQQNPITATDPVTEGSNHLRLLKKVLQQTFPNYDEAVTLSPAQLNDAALKSEAQSINGVWEHLSNLNLENNIALQGRNTAATVNGTLARMNSNDESEFGNATFPTRLRYFEDMFITRTGVEIAQFTSGPGGGLLVTDNLGALSEVAKLGAIQTVLAAWTFEDVLTLANNIALSGLAADDTPLQLARISATDDRIFGDDDAISNELRGALTDFYANDLGGTVRKVGGLAQLEQGGMTVTDLNVQSKKVGFRNPSLIALTVGRTLQQSDEGAFLQKSSNTGEDFIVPSLEVSTTTTFANVSNNQQTLTPDAGVTLTAYIGGSEITGALTIDSKSIVQLYWSTPTQVRAWGNGIN